MARLVVVGTDTDAGKTTFSSLWLAAFPETTYFKPLETGVSDTATIQARVPHARIVSPVHHFDKPIAPTLAALRAGVTLPHAQELLLFHTPLRIADLLIETFGSPCSPLNDDELQIEYIAIAGPVVLVTPSTVGAIGRSVALLRVLRSALVDVRAVVLMGPPDDYSQKTIARHGGIAVFNVPIPTTWDAAGFAECATAHRPTLLQIHALLVPPEPEATDLVQRDATVVWHPYTSLRGTHPPLPVTSAHGAYLGHPVGSERLLTVDAVSSWWTILHGHREPRLMQALAEAMNRVDHVMFGGMTHPYAVEVAERLLQTAPWSGGRVFFSDNGSTAVEVALKMAYQYWAHRAEPQRTLFIGFENAYHGDTFGAMAIGRDPLFFGTFEPLLFRAKQVPVSPEALDAVLQKHAHETAAIIIEPLVQGAGGMQMHAPATLHALRAVARKHGVLFIADEVMTCCRTGRFWASEGTAPDLLCAAKTLAGGVLPLAVTLASPEIVAAFDTADRAKTFFHGHSFTAHPLACAVAAENLRLLAEGTWLAESARINDYWQTIAEELRGRPNVKEVRITGTIIAIEVHAAGGYLASIGHAMREAALTKNVLLRPLGNVLYAMPPLCSSERVLTMIRDAFHTALERVA